MSFLHEPGHAGSGFILFAEAAEEGLANPNPGVVNGNFAVSDPGAPGFGWNAFGVASVADGRAVLGEGGLVFSDFSQTFVVPDGVTALRFTFASLSVRANGENPPDAFEVALLNTLTGEPLRGPPAGLSGTDAFLSIQADGRVYFAGGVRVPGVANSGDTLAFSGPLTVTVDLTGVGTIATLYFDLVGFGPSNSSVTLDEVWLSAEVPEQRPPVASDDEATTDEDTAVQIDVLANDVDLDGDPLALTGVTQPAHGTAVGNADGTVTYSPAEDFFGADSFTYTVSDGRGGTDTAEVRVTVNPVNDAPVARNDGFNLLEGGSLTVEARGVLANDDDVETLPTELLALQLTGPAHGTLTLNPDGSLTYVHDGSETTTDNFTYRVSDGTDLSNVATVTLTIEPVNDTPVGADDTYTLDEDTPLVVAAPGVLANDADAEGDPPQALLEEGPAHGALTLNPDGSFTYTPEPDFHGADQFTYRASDGAAESDVTTVALTVNPVNDAPLARDDAYEVNEDTVLRVPAHGVLTNDTDVEGDAVTARLVQGPRHGRLTLDPDGGFTYAPDPDYSGIDAFTYKAYDGEGESTPATVSLTVNEVPEGQMNVDHLVRVRYTGYVLNRRTNTFDTLATITNISAGSLLKAPMWLVVASLTPGSVSLANPTDRTAEGQPYVAVALPAAGLVPGASVSNILLKFRNPSRVKFTFTHSVWAVDPPAEGLASPGAEPSAETSRDFWPAEEAEAPGVPVEERTVVRAPTPESRETAPRASGRNEIEDNHPLGIGAPGSRLGGIGSGGRALARSSALSARWVSREPAPSPEGGGEQTRLPLLLDTSTSLEPPITPRLDPR